MWKLDLVPHDLGVNGSLLSRHLRILNSSRSQICCEESLSGSRMVFPAWCRKPCLRSPPRVVSTGLWRYPDLATCMIEVCPITEYDEAD